MRAKIESEKGFYFGDPCYVLGDRVYHKVWGTIYEYQDCVVKDPDTGYRFAAHGTAYGDGEYYGSNGRVYGVDSGTLALIPLELVEKSDGLEFGSVYSGAGIATMEADDGSFAVTMPDGNLFTVNTQSEFDYEDEEEDFEECFDEDMGYDPYLGCVTWEV